MANPTKGSEDANEDPKQPFVSQDDRPEVKLKPDTPLSELHVRDLATILGFFSTKSPFEAGKTSLKDFFDKPFPETTKDFVKEIKPEQIEKPPKFEKHEKFEKNEKHEKNEKLEKREIKELKAEKLEHDGVFEPGLPVGPDPRIEQIIQAVAGLTKQVGQLANQVEELRKKSSR
jgi:hypothetical protein